ncbi:ATP-binding protein, partial [Candidatus Hydrogenedentota bacterium]
DERIEGWRENFVCRLLSDEVVAIYSDITERKRAEEELRETSTRLQAVMSATEERIKIISPEGTILWVNEATEQRWKDPVGKKCWKVFESRNERCPHCVHPAIMEDGKPRSYETLLTSPDGEKAHVWARAVPMFDSSGSIYAILETGTDVTERKQLEEQLRQAQKMEAIGTLAGGIAHDFNNILGGMIGFTELARSELPEGSDAVEYLNNVLDSSERAKDLVSQILTFSRRKDVDKIAIMPHVIVKEALRLLRSSILKTIDIEQHIDAKSGAVMADPTQFHQIVVNLCTNACQAIGPDSGTITVTLRSVGVDAGEVETIPHLLEGAYVKLTVSDTGCGMDAQILGRVFEPFFTTKGEGKGTGLGMSTVYGIVQSLDGAITMDSVPGQGTTIAIYLPRIERTRETPHVSDGPIERGNGEHILFVDDEEALRKFANQISENAGYKVTTSPLAREALEVFRKNPEAFDLVFTDYAMPKMNGVELAREVSRVRPDIPIILASGFTEGLTDDEVEGAGISRLLKKPLDTETLGRAVREVLDEARGVEG